jgi:hypothetical protein
MEICMLSLQRVSERIDCRDVRTAEKWCRKNNVTVHLEGRKKYVLNIDLERVLEMKYIGSLQKLYPSDYEDVYYASKEGDLLSLYRTVNTTSDVLKEEYFTNETSFSSDEYQEDDLSSEFLKKYKDYL